MEKIVETEPSIGISYQCELPGKRQVILQSLVPRDCKIDDLNAVLDKMRTASERQYAFEMRDVLARQLEQEQKLADGHAERIAQVDQNVKNDWERRGRKGEIRLTAKEESEQRQAYQNVEESKRRIAMVKKQIAENETKIGA